MSYCDDCVHQYVCKYAKMVKEYEEKKPDVRFVTGLAIGYSVKCDFKNCGYDYDGRRNV